MLLPCSASGSIKIQGETNSGNVMDSDIKGPYGFGISVAVWPIDTVLIPTITLPSLPPKSISYLATGSSSFSLLLKLAPTVAAAITASTFSGTLLVPTDEAFSKLLASLGYTTLQDFQAKERAKLESILNYHIIPTNVFTRLEEVSKAGTRVTRLSGKSLTLGGAPSAPMVQGESGTANVVTRVSINGVYGSSGAVTVVTAAVWQIDAVLVPTMPVPVSPPPVSTPPPPRAPRPSPRPPAPSQRLVSWLSLSTTTFARALKAEPTVATAITTSTFRGTILVPTDEAFTAVLSFLGKTQGQLLADATLLSKVLNYHIIPAVILKDGAMLSAAGSQLTRTNLRSSPKVTLGGTASAPTVQGVRLTNNYPNRANVKMLADVNGMYYAGTASTGQTVALWQVDAVLLPS